MSFQQFATYFSAFSVLLPLSASAGPAIGESTGEFWVDGPADVQIGTDPSFPDVVIDHQGRSIFVWKSFIATRNEVYMRRFDANREPLGDPVIVNTTIEDDQSFPRVAVSGDNSFLVIFQSDEPDPNVGVDRKWVRSQAFTAAGAPNGTEQMLSTFSTGEPSNVNADIASLKDGGYVAIWRGRNSEGNDVNIWGRMIGADGVPTAAPFVVNSTMGVSENQPTVTGLSDGGFFVVWTGPDVHGRRFTADGTPVGNDFQIDTYVGGPESNPDVALHSDGRVMVVWDDEALGADRFIRGRLFSPDLVPQGSDFAINTLLSGVKEDPKVGNYGRAGFFVVWEDRVSVGNDVADSSIQGRIVTGTNQFGGPQMQINEWITGAQQFAAIGGRNDRIAIAWHSKSNPDTNSNVINGQFWSACGIFCDGFEGSND